jgi:hypothetical protein
MELFPIAQDPAQFLFRYWIMSANCCRWGATNAIVLSSFPNQAALTALGTWLRNSSIFSLNFYDWTCQDLAALV